MVFRTLIKRLRVILTPFLEIFYVACLSHKISFITLIKRPTVILTPFLESTQNLYDENIVRNFLVLEKKLYEN